MLERHNEDKVLDRNLTMWTMRQQPGGASPQERRDLLERTLHILEAKHGKKHYEVGVCCANLANAYGALGHYRRQEALLERALVIMEDTYGSKQHHGVEYQGIVTSLMMCYKNLGRGLDDEANEKLRMMDEFQNRVDWATRFHNSMVMPEEWN